MPEIVFVHVADKPRPPVVIPAPEPGALSFAVVRNKYSHAGSAAERIVLETGSREEAERRVAYELAHGARFAFYTTRKAEA
jgi:hypothetical protein